MYIPQDIAKLVLKYNEPGLFIVINSNIYWCNGKRFEYWCKLATGCFTEIICQNSRIFCLNYFYQKYEYKNSKWQHNPCKMTLLFDHIAGNIRIGNKLYYNSGLIIEYTESNKWTFSPLKTRQELQGKHIGDKVILKYYQNCLFAFGELNCAKYDFLNEEWIDLEKKPIYACIESCKLLNNKFYIFHVYNICIYECEANKWQILYFNKNLIFY